MPRALGQIDTRKHEAILDAAAEVLAERGLSAPLEEVARRAGVSKQTVYNHYRSKTQLVRTLISRRRNILTAPLEAPGAEDHPEETLTAYARVILGAVTAPGSVQLVRMAVAGASDMPDMARTIYDSGSQVLRDRLASFLLAEHTAGRMSVEDPDEAAELFIGMVTGGLQLRMLMGLIAASDPPSLDRRAKACAERFMRAYAV